MHNAAAKSHDSRDTHLSVSSASSGRTSFSSRCASVLTAATSAYSAKLPPLASEGPAKPTPTKIASNRQSTGVLGTAPSTRVYWCSYCEAKFLPKCDWKRHEEEFHERYKKYPCPDCNRVFWGASSFNHHHRSTHGCKTCPHADSVVRYVKKRRAWSCGFCAALLPSRDRYFDHVATHYEAGCAKVHWNHSLCIYGLLHQEPVYTAWKQLLASLYGHLPKAQQPRFAWDAEATGRASGFLEGPSPGKLQDLLEFFSGDSGEGKDLARLAHDLATKAFTQPPVVGPRSVKNLGLGSDARRPTSEPAKPRVSQRARVAQVAQVPQLSSSTQPAHGLQKTRGRIDSMTSMVDQTNAAQRTSLVAPSMVDDWMSMTGTVVDNSISEAQWLSGAG